MPRQKILEKLGINKFESKIYLAILDAGSAAISDIARRTGLYRPLVYKCLPSLLERGLISQSQKGKRKVYFAESPAKLESLTRQLADELSGEMPGLLAAYAASATRPIIKFFEGKKGIVNVYKDLLATCKKGDVYYRYESPKNYKEYRKYVPQEYLDRVRDKKEIDRLIITNEITKKQKQPRLGRIVKMVPPEYDLFVYDISQFIYGNKVAFIDFQSQMATIIESATFARFQRQIFKLLFDKL